MCSSGRGRRCIRGRRCYIRRRVGVILPFPQSGSSMASIGATFDGGLGELFCTGKGGESFLCREKGGGTDSLKRQCLAPFFKPIFPHRVRRNGSPGPC